MSIPFNPAQGAGARPFGSARAVVSAVAREAMHAVDRVLSNYRGRRARREILALSDHLLDDIGVTRAQLDRLP